MSPDIPNLPTPADLQAADPDDLRSMLVTDRALASYFAARADVVAEVLAWRHRKGNPVFPSAALNVEEVMEKTSMSKGWLYREARAGRLPFARRLGRRIVFDERGLDRWISRRPRV